MREDDIFLVVIRLKILVRDLTSPLVTNEQSYLTEEPIQGRRSIEKPEEQENRVLTRCDVCTAQAPRPLSTSTVGPKPCSFWHRVHGPKRVDSTREATFFVR